MCSKCFSWTVWASTLLFTAILVGQGRRLPPVSPTYRPPREVRQPFYSLGAVGDACQSPTGCDANQGLACHNFSCVRCSQVCETCRYDHDCCNGLGCSHDGFCHG